MAARAVVTGRTPGIGLRRRCARHDGYDVYAGPGGPRAGAIADAAAAAGLASVHPITVDVTDDAR
jgi:NAD(P)-dependent dehydrogenase (short-subunit alcohol dehydrogenase family)